MLANRFLETHPNMSTLDIEKDSERQFSGLDGVWEDAKEILVLK